MRWRGKMNVPFLFAQVAFTSFSACDKQQAGKKLGIDFLSPLPMSQGFTHLRCRIKVWHARPLGCDNKKIRAALTKCQAEPVEA